MKALVRWATGKRLTNRLPELGLVTPPTTAVVFLLVWFSNLQRFVCLGIITHNQLFDFKYCLVLRVIFPEEIDRDYSQLPVVRRLFGP